MKAQPHSAHVSTPAAVFSVAQTGLGAWAERSTSQRIQILSSTTGRPASVGMHVYTNRAGDDLFDFIMQHLDAEERVWFAEDLAKAVSQALEAHSLEPLGQVLGDWEETVEIKLDPVLSRELDEAFDEADRERAARRR